MPEPKICQIMVNLEPTFYDIVKKIMEKENLSASGYCRQLIISDLKAKGLLTDGMVTKVLVGNWSVNA